MTGPPVVVAFYGGLGEIGANMASVEVDGQIALIDCGLTFPDAEHFGIDLILPDWRALRERAGDVHCVVLTHGHEDHMGALPFFLRDFPGLPVYASRLTLGLIRAKLEEHPGVAGRPAASRGGRAGPRPGRSTFEFVQVTHSIPDGIAVAVHTPHGTILHTGDFKLDQTPIDGRADRPAAPRPARRRRRGAAAGRLHERGVPRPRPHRAGRRRHAARRLRRVHGSDHRSRRSPATCTACSR